jgi:hypothetical protein
LQGNFHCLSEIAYFPKILWLQAAQISLTKKNLPGKPGRLSCFNPQPSYVCVWSPRRQGAKNMSGAHLTKARAGAPVFDEPGEFLR